MSLFNPNAACEDPKKIFGLPYTLSDAEIVLLPIHFDATASYHKGSSDGPKQLLKASSQIDLYDPILKNCWKNKIYYHHNFIDLKSQNKVLRKEVKKYLKQPKKKKKTSINSACKTIHSEIKQKTLSLLNKNKTLISLGGDHSTPLGLMWALSEKFNSFSILHLDAHFDLRKSYQDFDFSHASIMYNASKIKPCKEIIHLGIRDFCEEELHRANTNKKSTVFFDHQIKERLFKGENWHTITKDILKRITSKYLYISLDIDVLHPSLCPGTGTPVPGGLMFSELCYLLDELSKKNIKIIGADLSEVSNQKDSDLDANIGARLLLKLCNVIKKTNG